VRPVLSVLTIMLMLPCTKLVAQALLPNGARVRISTPGLVLDHREGYLDAGYVLILDWSQRVAVPLTSVTKLERRVRKSNETAGVI